MNPNTLDHSAPSLFKRRPSRVSQLALYSALALFLMVADARFRITDPVRVAVATVLTTAGSTPRPRGGRAGSRAIDQRADRRRRRDTPRTCPDRRDDL